MKDYTEIFSKIKSIEINTKAQIILIRKLKQSILLEKFSEENDNCLKLDNSFVFSSQSLIDFFNLDPEYIYRIKHHENSIFIEAKTNQYFNRINSKLPEFFLNKNELVNFIINH